jgi:hypothetical protein
MAPSCLVYLVSSIRVLFHFWSVLKEMRVPRGHSASRAVRVRCKGSKKLRTSFEKISEACLDPKPEPVCEMETSVNGGCVEVVETSEVEQTFIEETVVVVEKATEGEVSEITEREDEEASVDIDGAPEVSDFLFLDDLLFDDGNATDLDALQAFSVDGQFDSQFGAGASETTVPNVEAVVEAPVPMELDAASLGGR